MSLRCLLSRLSGQGRWDAVFRFLDLAAELRNKVYLMHLTSGYVHIESRGRYTALPPPILHVCLQIREEARGIYSSTNISHFEGVSSLRLNGIDEESRNTEWLKDAAKCLLSRAQPDVHAIRQIERPRHKGVYHTKSAEELSADLAKRLFDGGLSKSDLNFSLGLMVVSRVPDGSASCCRRDECQTIRSPPGAPAALSFTTEHWLGVGKEVQDLIEEEKTT